MHKDFPRVMITSVLPLFMNHSVDECKLLNVLLRYVANNQDAMPPIRLYEGEVLNGVVSTMTNKIADRVDEYLSALFTV